MLMKVYDHLFGLYGPQGWWPLLGHEGVNPTKTGSVKGYHPGDYSFPKSRAQCFEICVGAILTQNTSWPQVEKALLALREHGCLDAGRIMDIDHAALSSLIRPAGYHNQKAKALKVFAKFFLEVEGIPSREDLLSLWGVGEETADSMLLYAFGVPSFVVDAYTKRVFEHNALGPTGGSYARWKAFFEEELDRDVPLFQEFHALLVEHAKRWYSKKPYGEGCRIGEVVS